MNIRRLPKFNGGWTIPRGSGTAPPQVTGSRIMPRAAIAGSLKLGRPVSM